MLKLRSEAEAAAAQCKAAKQAALKSAREREVCVRVCVCRCGAWARARGGSGTAQSQGGRHLAGRLLAAAFHCSAAAKAMDMCMHMCTYEHSKPTASPPCDPHPPIHPSREAGGAAAPGGRCRRPGSGQGRRAGARGHTACAAVEAAGGRAGAAGGQGPPRRQAVQVAVRCITFNPDVLASPFLFGHLLTHTGRTNWCTTPCTVHNCIVNNNMQQMIAPECTFLCVLCLRPAGAPRCAPAGHGGCQRTHRQQCWGGGARPRQGGPGALRR